DAVVGIVPVEPGLGDAGLVQRFDTPGRALAQLLQFAELDRLGGARLRAGRLLAHAEPDVAEGALEHASAPGPLLEHPVGAGGDAVAAAVADIGLHDHGPELGAEDRPGRAHVQAGGVRAV